MHCCILLDECTSVSQRLKCLVALPPAVSRRFSELSDASDPLVKKEGLRELFRAFITSPDADANVHVSALLSRLSSTAEPADPSIAKLITRLAADYPNDRGAVCPLLLNYLVLEPGTSFFMGANEPHAYISGDCIEVMALSDNVVRAGLTPKFKDVDTLCSMLSYRFVVLTYLLRSMSNPCTLWCTGLFARLPLLLLRI
jgi:mannose-6-phosphate isomerase class I